LALLSKCLARSDKSGDVAAATNGRMSNILKPIDLTDLAIRRAVFAVLDGLAAEHRANRKGDDRLSVRGLAYVVSWQFDPEQAQR
jgi:hypothetical protein